MCTQRTHLDYTVSLGIEMGRQARQHWYTLYKNVQAQLDAYQGNDSINLLIRKLADEQGYDAKVVSRMLKAGNFLDRIAGPCSSEQVGCGYAHIEQLERLHQLNSEVALSLVQSTLANQQTLLDLRNITEGHAKSVGTPTTSRARARSRVAEHERRCGELLEISGPDFFGYSEGEMIKVVHSDLFNQFFMIQVDGHPKAAIFIRVGDTSRKEERAAADLLKLASLARMYFEKVWYVFPHGSSLVHELAFYAHRMNSFRKWLFLGTLNEEASLIEPFHNLGKTVERELFGWSDPLGWEGFSLPSKRRASGTFRPVSNETSKKA